MTTADWDALAARYCQPDFITDDPIQFAHWYRHGDDWRTAELAGFLAALFSYGRRDVIRQTVSGILEKLEEGASGDPLAGLLAMTPKQLAKRFSGFYYRFNTSADLVDVLTALRYLYTEAGSLKAVWAQHYTQAEGNLQAAIYGMRQALMHGPGRAPNRPFSNGMKFLFANPLQGSAAKRFNMYLRWMVRKDAVDLGLWAEVMPAAALVFPLDTHVATMARHYGITTRQANDWKTAEAITDYFRKHCPEDPVRYDFALFGLGVNRDEPAQPSRLIKARVTR